MIVLLLLRGGDGGEVTDPARVTTRGDSGVVVPEGGDNDVAGVGDARGVNPCGRGVPLPREPARARGDEDVPGGVAPNEVLLRLGLLNGEELLGRDWVGARLTACQPSSWVAGGVVIKEAAAEAGRVVRRLSQAARRGGETEVGRDRIRAAVSCDQRPRDDGATMSVSVTGDGEAGRANEFGSKADERGAAPEGEAAAVQLSVTGTGEGDDSTAKGDADLGDVGAGDKGTRPPDNGADTVGGDAVAIMFVTGAAAKLLGKGRPPGGELGRDNGAAPGDPPGEPAPAQPFDSGVENAGVEATGTDGVRTGDTGTGVTTVGDGDGEGAGQPAPEGEVQAVGARGTGALAVDGGILAAALQLETTIGVATAVPQPDTGVVAPPTGGSAPRVLPHPGVDDHPADEAAGEGTGENGVVTEPQPPVLALGVVAPAVVAPGTGVPKVLQLVRPDEGVDVVGTGAAAKAFGDGLVQPAPADGVLAFRERGVVAELMGWATLTAPTGAHAAVGAGADGVAAPQPTEGVSTGGGVVAHPDGAGLVQPVTEGAD